MFKGDICHHIARLNGRWAEFTGQELWHGGPCSSFQLDVACNWKLAVENYCESYHLPWVHPGLNSYSRIEDHYNIVEPGIFAGQGTRVYNPQKTAGAPSFEDFSGLSSKWDTGAEYIALFPNILYGVHRDHAFAILLEPAAMDRTIERVEIYYADETMLSDDMARARQQNASLWRQVFDEDVFVVEGMQRGRAADAFDGGRFSPVLDEATHCLHHWVAERFLAAG